MLSELRKKMRLAALTSAAEMIGMHHESADEDFHGFSPEEFEAYSLECVAVKNQIETIARRFSKKHDL